ncbi:c-type cytochrome biogenesis protein CcsB [Brevibacterium sp. 50QC2O2]|jgi:cytochrome c-type biogenesis protein CcsB|uniref:c-type cytochrome biogenesis protein CcsB n=1 Tax=Brevibacterium TaxID=1696 RepID=UPI00211C1B0E|nr:MULTISPECIES: c-type cytochrome biogenesis protein CcsB [unclassified Brevibacterium]MCQ9368241.1 c-type cytochrome biogenesis protein CcsB [Brevibacterium sp. 91QC2O2]MCQ9385579.1 c-type cytochrome biogenesis protein CcsB [Brevibacterium sp. 68QC2CO]MCQ9389208.1 c-type cytochrome biogenesis protein CcsB [Brevibacterium sp. 50QC2O2]
MDVNITLASWSNLLLYSALAVYALSFLFYAFDLFGRQRVTAADAAREQGKKTAGAGTAGAAGRAANAAGAQSRTTGRKRSVVGSGATAVAEKTAEKASVSHQATGAGKSGGGAAGKSGAAGESDAAVTGGRRKLAALGTNMFVIGLLLHIASIVTRCLSVMRVPWGNMMEYLMVATAIAGIVYLVVMKWRDVRYLGTFVSGAIMMGLGLCITVFYTPAAQLVPALQSYWIYIHVPIAILSTALLSISAALAVFQMLKAFVETRHAAVESAKKKAAKAEARAQKVAAAEGGESAPVASSQAKRAQRESASVKGVPGWLRWLDKDRIPSSKSIEQVSYRIAAVGFITWTFTLIAGAIWAEVAWGRYWGWDSKEIWTFVVWVVYAAYLHSRATRGWSANKVAVLNLVGFLCIVFNFTIVNTYFNGLHSYSGL